LGKQIVRPVRFVEQIERMYADGVRVFVEVGPQAVLTGLVGAILEGRDHLAIALDRKGQDGVTQFWRALAQLAVAGYALDFARLLEGYETVEPPPARPSKPLSVSINGANYGKRYPLAANLAAVNATTGDVASLAKPNPVASSRPPQPSQMDTEFTPSPPIGATPYPNMRTDPAPQNGAATHQQRNSEAQPDRTFRMSGAAPPADWIAAFQQAQQQTLEAHIHFQKTMAESHQAFLKAAESSLMGLTHLAGNFMPCRRRRMWMARWQMGPGTGTRKPTRRRSLRQ
jgi:acyl transferase domain-containing protein